MEGEFGGPHIDSALFTIKKIVMAIPGIDSGVMGSGNRNKVFLPPLPTQSRFNGR
jgi:hypothetical protein